MVAHRRAVLTGVFLASAWTVSSSSPCPGAAEDDSSCLLQTALKAQRSGKLDNSNAKSVGKAGSSSEGPAKLLQEVLATATRVQSRGGQATPEEEEMMQTIAQMLDDVSIPALEADMLENQRQVDRVSGAVNSCEAMRVNMDTEVGGVAERRFLVATSRVSHRNCRALEGEFEIDKASKCGNFADYAAGLMPPTSVLPNPASPSESMEAFLRSNHEWFNTRYEQYLMHKGQCDQATGFHAAKLMECVGSQTAFETASCAMPTALHSMCSPYTTCRNGADGEQVETWEDVIAAEAQRKLSFITLKKIKCLILSFTEVVGDARNQAISDCAVADLAIRYDGSEFDPGLLNITYPVLAPRVMCSEQEVAVSLLPCGIEFIAAEYAAPALPANAQAAACMPCVGVPTVQTAPVVLA